MYLQEHTRNNASFGLVSPCHLELYFSILCVVMADINNRSRSCSARIRDDANCCCFLKQVQHRYNKVRANSMRDSRQQLQDIMQETMQTVQEASDSSSVMVS